MPDVQPTNNPVPSDHPADARDNFKRLDEVINLQATQTNPTRTGRTLNTIYGIESMYIASPINGGVWSSGVEFTAYNQYMAFNGVTYKPSFSTTLPYETQSSDPTSEPDSNFVEPFSEINSTNISDYTDLVYKQSALNSAIDNMIAGIPVIANAGDICSTGGTVWECLNSPPSSISDFSTKNVIHSDDFMDGSSNHTANLLEFYNYCIDNGNDGWLMPGDYIIDLGQLSFDNGHTDKALPNILTSGHSVTKFTASSDIDSFYLSFTNGVAVSGVGRFWRGGFHGGLSFRPSGAVSGLPNNHGLILSGLESTKFGFFDGEGIGGDTVHIKRNLFGGSNPDPYSVALCKFEGARGVRNGGMAFNNDNYVGMNVCEIDFIRAIENSGGVFSGQGASNTVKSISSGSCAGWGVGDQPDVVGGASTRFTLGSAEFDDIEFGIDSSISSQSDYGKHRFVHRYNFGPLNPSGGYWPRKALKVGNSTRTVVGLKFNTIDRIEVGGTKVDLGEFADFSNAASFLSQVNIERQILDNASFGFENSDLFTNFNTGSEVRYSIPFSIVIDTFKLNTTYVKVRNSGAVTVKNGGFASSANFVGYDQPLEGAASRLYDTANFEYTAPASTMYRIKANLAMSLNSGNRVRMAIFRNGSLISSDFDYCIATGPQTYTIEGDFLLNAGDLIKINADQNSGSDVTVGGTSSTNDSYLSVINL